MPLIDVLSSMEKYSGLKSFQILGCMAGCPTVDQGVTSVVISDY